jgi:hypothetical protein
MTGSKEEKLALGGDLILASELIPQELVAEIVHWNIRTNGLKLVKLL